MINEKKAQNYASKYRVIARRELKKKKYNSALDALYHCAALHYRTQIQLTDKDAEEILSKLNESMFEPIICNSDDVILLYDSIAISNLALSYQYLEALIATKREIVYVVSKIDDNDDWSKTLYEIASKAPNCKLIIIGGKKDYLWKIKQIREAIKKYSPRTVFLHMNNCDVWGYVAFCDITNSTMYYINHGDEQFWLRLNNINYVIEFRGMGVYTTFSFRGISKEQCIVNPYYPIIKSRKFNGFNFKIPTNSIIVFSGGRFVKVYSEDNIFLKTIKKMLKDNPNVFYIFAGTGNDAPMKQFIRENDLDNRWKVLEYRKDLVGVLDNVDIYMGTFPQSGGLMVQYAAATGTPMVEMNTDNGGVAEDLLPKLGDVKITCENWNEYYDMLNKLINDKDFRDAVSRKTRGSVVTTQEFIENLEHIITTHESRYGYVIRENNISKRAARLLEAENKYLHNIPRIMVNPLMLKHFPLTAIKNLILFLLTRTNSKENY